MSIVMAAGEKFVLLPFAITHVTLTKIQQM